MTKQNNNTEWQYKMSIQNGPGPKWSLFTVPAEIIVIEISVLIFCGQWPFCLCRFVINTITLHIRILFCMQKACSRSAPISIYTNACSQFWWLICFPLCTLCDQTVFVVWDILIEMCNFSILLKLENNSCTETIQTHRRLKGTLI